MEEETKETGDKGGMEERKWETGNKGGGRREAGEGFIHSSIISLLTSHF
ncbi:MAG: hypothetical protein KAF40_09945 [Flavihumibacter sp.]|nr:hypothetical protein [Flavihumibacter sp.]